MSYRPVVLASARKEMADAVIWYDQQKEGLGERFLITVRAYIKQVSELPEIYQLVSKYYRHCKIDTFPFVIVYRINKKKQEIVVVSIFHTSKKPVKRK